jgi:type I restriction enzyme S subunit
LDDLTHLPAGIERLRNIIVDLAVAGQLAEPASQGETADDLLAQIAAERMALGLKGGVTALEPDPSFPKRWRLVSLGDILVHCRNGTGSSPNNIGQGYPLLRISAGTSRRDALVDLSDYKFVALTKEQAEPYFLKPGDLLACRFNGNLHYVGRVSQVPENLSGSILHPDKLICIRAIVVSHAYLRYVLNSRFVRKQIESVATTTAGNIGVNGKQIKALAIPLAPLSEQERIVQCLDEAFSLLDRLSLECDEERAARRALSRSALHELGDGRGRRSLEMLQDIIRTADDIADFEDAILHLAVNGRLTDSTASDEDASELVSRIKGLVLDSSDLVNGQGIPISAPYGLPAMWRWVAFGALLTNIEAGWSPNALNRPKEGDEWGVLKVSACTWGEFRAMENKALASGQSPRPKLEVRPGDFLISRANTSELVARSVVVDQTLPHLMLSDKTLRLSVVEGCNPRYLNLANLSPVARMHYEREATGTSRSMKNVSQRIIRRTPIPLPPRAEQDRIVAVVDELMTLLRRLRLQLAA